MSSVWSAVASAASATVSKLVTASAGLPFETGEEVSSFAGKTPWRLYKGKKDGERVSLFLYNLKEKKSDRELGVVRNAVRRLRIMKHPYLLKCIEAGELNVDGKGNGTIYIITEPVQPLEDVLAQLQEAPASLAWGVYTLAAALNFLNIDCKSVHGQISLASIFVDRGMDWKLGGFELLGEADKADEPFYSLCKDFLPKRYQSPELARGNIEVLRKIPVAADWWALGCTVFEVFCGQIRSPADLKNIDAMPEVLRPDYMRMLSANPAGRLRPIELLSNPLFEEDYVSLHLFLETLNVKDSVEKDRFFTKLAERIPALPKAAAQWKVLPALINSLEYGGGSARALEPLLKIAQLLSEEDMQSQVVPTIVKLFANPDRAMRIPLLERLPTLVPHISTKLLNDSVFNNVAMGFGDTSPVLRELTVKAMVPLAPKLLPRSMQQVMRAFAKLQLDEEAAIRTNTTICLGKIAAYIDGSTREKVLIPACCRALKDPFAPGRCAALMSLTATQQYHKAMDVATKIIPAITPCALDPEREVRETAMQSLRVYMSVIERAAANVGKPEAERADAPVKDDLSLAADKVLDSMSWLTSSLKSAVSGGGTPAPVAPGSASASKGYGTSATTKPASTLNAPAPAPAPASYTPPPMPSSASCAARPSGTPPPPPPPLPPPVAPAAKAESDGWDDDDALNEAFAMPSSSMFGGAMSSGANGGESCDDLFGSLGQASAPKSSAGVNSSTQQRSPMPNVGTLNLSSASPPPISKPAVPAARPAAPMGLGAMGQGTARPLAPAGAPSMASMGPRPVAQGTPPIGAMPSTGAPSMAMGSTMPMSTAAPSMAAMASRPTSAMGTPGIGSMGPVASPAMGSTGAPVMAPIAPIGAPPMASRGGGVVQGSGGLGASPLMGGVGVGSPMGGMAKPVAPVSSFMPTLAPPKAAGMSDPFATLGMAAPLTPMQMSQPTPNLDSLDPFAMLSSGGAQQRGAPKKPSATKTNANDWDQW